MKILKQSWQVIFHIPEGYDSIEKWLEWVARTCYKSYDKITDSSAQKLIKTLLNRGHTAMFEHAVVTARIITDRGISHELVRHRIASFAQESTRYVDYTKERDGVADLQVIDQGFEGQARYIWCKKCEEAWEGYSELRKLGVKPEFARSLLPTCTKTEIVITANLREWRTIFGLRADSPAHPLVREIAKGILKELSDRISIIFDDQKEKFLNERERI